MFYRKFLSFCSCIHDICDFSNKSKQATAVRTSLFVSLTNSLCGWRCSGGLVAVIVETRATPVVASRHNRPIQSSLSSRCAVGGTVRFYQRRRRRRHSITHHGGRSGRPCPPGAAATVAVAVTLSFGARVLVSVYGVYVCMCCACATVYFFECACLCAWVCVWLRVCVCAVRPVSLVYVCVRPFRSVW